MNIELTLLAAMLLVGLSFLFNSIDPAAKVAEAFSLIPRYTADGFAHHDFNAKFIDVNNNVIAKF